MTRAFAVAVLLAVISLAASSSATGVLDPSPPVVTYSLEGRLGSNDWYTSDVVVKWFFSDAESGIKAFVGCKWVTLSADTPGVNQTCAVTNNADVISVVQIPLKLDRTPPQVTAAVPDRPADHEGWYNHPVGFAYQGADVTSGLDGCTSVSYAGPDSAAASVSGSCRDRAGNTSPSIGLPFRYDATAPSLGKVEVEANDHGVRLNWKSSRDTVAVEVVRTLEPKGTAAPVFRGRANAYRDRGLKNGHRYRYVLTGVDQAGNAATTALTAVPRGPLRSPVEDARVGSPPLLAWVPVRKATYYNVQLFRGTRKVLSAWPAKAHLRLRRTWVYHGRRYRLKRGAYRWVAWPGFGPRSAQRYGRLIGSSTFVFAP
jgi:hypothetical protein